MRFLLICVLILFSSCVQTPAPRIHALEIPHRVVDSSKKIPNKILTCPGKISLEGESGGIVTGTVFPIYSKEINDRHYEVYFITAKHVVDGVTPTKIEFYSIPEKNWEISSQVTLILGDVKTLFAHKTIDVALVKAKSEVYIPLIDITVEHPKFMEEVVAVGCPCGEPLVVTHGRVVRPSLYKGLWLITAPVVPGNSGGPIISLRTGKVVGITSRVYVINNGYSSSYVGHMHEMVPSYLFYDMIIDEIDKDLLR